MRRLGELAQLVDGEIVAQSDSRELAELEVVGAASVSRAGPQEITFVTSSRYFQEFLDSEAIAAVISRDVEISDLPEKPCIQVDDVTGAFVELVELFQPPIERAPVGISPQAIVSPSARISDDVCIYPGAVIMDNVEIGFGTVIYPNATIMENSVIGANVQIFPGAVLYEKTVVGDRAIIHAGAVLGAYGFGYRSNSGVHELSAQLGNVVIGNDVEVGANTTIDRGTFDSTTVGAGTKLDNLVMIGHNCVVGEHNLLCSQVGVAGSCTTGDYVVMGGQVGMADHLNIGSHVSIGAKSGLMHDIPEGQKFFGIPARPARQEMQILANRAKLPEMRKTIKKIVKQLDELASNNSSESSNEDSRAA